MQVTVVNVAQNNNGLHNIRKNIYTFLSNSERLNKNIFSNKNKFGSLEILWA